MTKLEQYAAKAAESLAATEAATTARERAYHHRAQAIWRRLMVGIVEAEEPVMPNSAGSTPSKPDRP